MAHSPKSTYQIKYMFVCTDIIGSQRIEHNWREVGDVRDNFCIRLNIGVTANARIKRVIFTSKLKI